MSLIEIKKESPFGRDCHGLWPQNDRENNDIDDNNNNDKI
jgi:ribonuclease I